MGVVVVRALVLRHDVVVFAALLVCVVDWKSLYESNCWGGGQLMLL